MSEISQSAKGMAETANHRACVSVLGKSPLKRIDSVFVTNMVYSHGIQTTLWTDVGFWYLLLIT